MSVKQSPDFLDLASGSKPSAKHTAAYEQTDEAERDSTSTSEVIVERTPASTGTDGDKPLDINLVEALSSSGRLETAAFECLAAHISDQRAQALMHMLGWPDTFTCFALAGTPATLFDTCAQKIRQSVHDLGGTHCLIGRNEDACVALIAVHSAVTPEVTCTATLPAFDTNSPVALGSQMTGITGAADTVTATISTLHAASAFMGPTHPLRAADALPERALAGDKAAKQELYHTVYRRLQTSDDQINLDTVTAFLEHGSALDTAARALNVHPNTVRYRLKRIAETCGWDATNPRDAFVLHTAIIIGRMQDRANEKQH